MAILLLGCGAPLIEPDGAAAAVRANRCEAQPAKTFRAFIEGAQSPTETDATVIGHVVLDSPARHRYLLRDASGAESRLTVMGDQPVPGIEEGKSYSFRVDYVGGSPTASGIIVRDQDGILFAALTDGRIGSHVLKEGIPDFEVAMKPPECAGRAHGSCLESAVNLPVEIRSGASAAILYHGESAILGRYTVSVLTAQKVKYSRHCKDAGVSGISFTIARSEPAKYRR